MKTFKQFLEAKYIDAISKNSQTGEEEGSYFNVPDEIVPELNKFQEEIEELEVKLKKLEVKINQSILKNANYLFVNPNEVSKKICEEINDVSILEKYGINKINIFKSTLDVCLKLANELKQKGKDKIADLIVNCAYFIHNMNEKKVLQKKRTNLLISVGATGNLHGHLNQKGLKMKQAIYDKTPLLGLEPKT